MEHSDNPTPQKSEYLKQQIEFEKDNLRFYQSFILPLLTGLIVAFISRDRIGVLTAYIFIIAGLVAFVLLFLYRLILLRRIKRYITELSKL